MPWKAVWKDSPIVPGDRSGTPTSLPAQVEAAIVASKKEQPDSDGRKIRERLLRRLPHAIKVPAGSTVHAVLDRHGLVGRASRPRTPAHGTPLSDGLHPNDLWCADYKGEFQLMKCPREVYTPSPRRYDGLLEVAS